MKKRFLSLGIATLGLVASMGLASCGGNNSATLKYKDANGTEQEVKVEKTSDKKQVANIIEALNYTAYNSKVTTDLTKIGLQGSLKANAKVDLSNNMFIQLEANENLNLIAQLGEVAENGTIADIVNGLGLSVDLNGTTKLNMDLGQLGKTNMEIKENVSVYEGKEKLYVDLGLDSTTTTDTTSATAVSNKTTIKGYVVKSQLMNVENPVGVSVAGYRTTYNKLKEFNLFSMLGLKEAEFKTIDSYLSDSNLTLEKVVSDYGISVAEFKDGVATFEANLVGGDKLPFTGSLKASVGLNIETFVPTKIYASTTNLEVNVKDTFKLKVSNLELNLALNTNTSPTTTTATADYDKDVTEDIRTLIQTGSSMIGGFGL
jgi:hypothetical protein